MALVIVSLLTGSEFVGTFLREDDDCIEISKARRMTASQEGMLLYPAATIGATESGAVRFFKSNVAFVCEATTEMQDYYLQQTSGIQLARGKVNR